MFLLWFTWSIFGRSSRLVPRVEFGSTSSRVKWHTGGPPSAPELLWRSRGPLSSKSSANAVFSCHASRLHQCAFPSLLQLIFTSIEHCQLDNATLSVPICNGLWALLPSAMVNIGSVRSAFFFWSIRLQKNEPAGNSDVRLLTADIVYCVSVGLR
jgi:hypothetical protein